MGHEQNLIWLEMASIQLGIVAKGVFRVGFEMG